MGQWLDDAAKGFAEGAYNRRQVLRRGGAVAVGAVIGSVTGSLSAFTSVALAACPDGHRCGRGESCCKNDCCDNAHERCCAGRCISNRRECCGLNPVVHGKVCGLHEKCCAVVGICYSPATHHCCHYEKVCKKDEECCGSALEPRCCAPGETCQHGVCMKPRQGMCGPEAYLCGSSLCCAKGSPCCDPDCPEGMGAPGQSVCCSGINGAGSCFADPGGERRWSGAGDLLLCRRAGRLHLWCRRRMLHHQDLLREGRLLRREGRMPPERCLWL